MRFPWFARLWKPETLGFAAERVRPFVLHTYYNDFAYNDPRPDNERIFAWHILPPNQEVVGDKENEHLEVLQKDKSARVIIYCNTFYGLLTDLSSRDCFSHRTDIAIRYVSTVDSRQS